MDDNLRDVVEAFQRWLHVPDSDAILFALATVTANRMGGDPIWGLIVGPPGSGKTEIIHSLARQPDCHLAATLTEASLLSGTPKKEMAKDAKGGLLKEIGAFGIILIKDFGAILTLNKDTRGPILQALREIYDGEWTRWVGVDGGRALHWAGKVGVLGGATTAIDGHHVVMATLGERFVFYRLPEVEGERQGLAALNHQGQEYQMRQELAAAVDSFFACLELPRQPSRLAPEVERWLVRLAVFTTRCRSAVERDPRTREIELVPDAEAPARLVKVLAGLLKALRVIGADLEASYRIVQKTAFDSMPVLRFGVVKLLAETASRLTTPEIAQRLSYPTQTTRRALEELNCFAVVEREPGYRDSWWLSDYALELWQTIKDVPESREVECKAHEPLNTRYTFNSIFRERVVDLRGDEAVANNQDADRSAGSDDEVVLATELVALAKARGYPAYRVNDWTAVVGTPEAWRCFAATASIDTLRRTIEHLRSEASYEGVA